MARFEVVVTIVVVLDIADDVIALHSDPQWLANFYQLDTPELIAEHLAYHLGIRDSDLSSLDGFADWPDSDETRLVSIRFNDYDTRRLSG